MSDTKLRSSIIRLAHTNPELRPHLLPLLSEGKTAANAPGPHAKEYVQDKLRSLKSGGSGWLTSDFFTAAEWRRQRTDQENTKDIRTGLANDYMDVNEKQLQKASHDLTRELRSILGNNLKLRGFISNVEWLLSGSKFIDRSKEDLESLIKQADGLSRNPPPKEVGITPDQVLLASGAIKRVAEAELARVIAVKEAINDAAPSFLAWYKVN